MGKANSHSTKITKSIIKEKIRKLKVDELAKQSGFKQRKEKKVKAEHFIIGFFLMFLNGNISFAKWAEQISFLIKKTFPSKIFGKE